ncbi:MAG TPA: MbnP family protein [Flavobacteriales bacterium]|nr:MbnP family protein [Flavobacteriales bacterium]
MRAFISETAAMNDVNSSLLRNSFSQKAVHLHAMKYILLLLTVLALGLASCRKKKQEPDPADPAPATTGTLRINFVTKFNGAPFTFYTDYYNPLNQRVQFEIFKFFCTNFYAYNAAGDSVLVKDAFKYDFATGATYFSVPMQPGDYTGMKLGYGVDSSRNHLDPTAYDPKHPLSYNQANSMHWGWTAGYIFMKFEGRADTSGTGTGPLDVFLAFHPGNDVCYEPSPFLPKNFNVTVGQTTVLNLAMHVDQFFTTATDTLDFRYDNFTHFTDNPGLAKIISKNIAKSFAFE